MNQRPRTFLSSQFHPPVVFSPVQVGRKTSAPPSIRATKRLGAGSVETTLKALASLSTGPSKSKDLTSFCQKCVEGESTLSTGIKGKHSSNCPSRYQPSARSGAGRDMALPSLGCATHEGASKGKRLAFPAGCAEILGGWRGIFRRSPFLLLRGSRNQPPSGEGLVLLSTPKHQVRSL